MEEKEKFICENMKNIKILDRNIGHKNTLGVLLVAENFIFLDNFIYKLTDIKI